MDPKMKSRAEKLMKYCHSQVGDSLRAVGCHTADEYEVVFVREDLVPEYSREDIEQFITTSQDISTDLETLDDGMGAPEASLHLLEEGLAIQFHHPEEKVTFVTVDQGVGKNFTSFVSDCQERMGY